MASPIQLKNNAIGRLTSGVSGSAITLTLVSGDGAKFPTLTGPQYFPATLIRASDSAVEIVKVTARSGDVLTVVRAQEGTSGLVLLAGDRVELRFTAGTLTDEIARVEAIADGAVAVANGAVDDAADAQATADAALPKAGGDMTGDMSFSGTGRRIKGDLSNATESSRLMFQTTTANGASYLGAVPVGSGVSAGFVAYGGADPANVAGFKAELIGGNEARLSSFKNGSGVFAPMTFYAGGAERLRIGSDGKISTVGGEVIADPAATNKALILSGGTALDVDGAGIVLRGATHATNPGAAEVHAGGVERVRVGADGGVQSAIVGQTGLFPDFGCRAWVNFNGSPMTGTYSRAGTTVTVTMASHGLSTGQTVSLDFTSGTATDGSYPVTVIDANSFTVVDSASGSTSGNVTRQISIRGSGNVSSVVDNDVGDYSVNFITPMPDDRYAAVALTSSNITRVSGSGTPYQTTSFRMQSVSLAGGFIDSDFANVSFFR